MATSSEPPAPAAEPRPKRSPALADRVVLVVGGGRGIGRALALGLAEAGAAVAVADPGVDLEGRDGDPEPAETVARTIRDAGGRAFAVAQGLPDAAAAHALVGRVRAELGGLHAVLVTAGVRRVRGILKASDDDLEASLEAPFRVAFRATQAAARTFIELGEGGVVLLAAGPQAFFGAARHALIGAGEGAVVALARSAAVELRRHGIRVNALVPTARTRATEALPTFQGIQPESLGPEHLVPVVVYLLSEAAREVTGEAIGVAGTRVYGIRSREATGAFAADGERFGVDELARSWSEVSRG